MGLKFENAFVIKAPIDKVWAYLTDPYRVAPALPGAQVTEKTDEKTYKGTITVKVGPVSAKYKGTAVFERLDPATHTAEISAKGQDLSGRGGADMKLSSALKEQAPGETEVTLVSDVNVTGILAQFGRGLMQDVSDQMLKRFTDAMRAELEKPDAAEMAAVVKETLDTDETLPPMDADQLPALPPPEGPQTRPVADAPVFAGPSPGYAGGANPSQTNPLPAQAGPPPPSSVSAPIEVVSFGSQIAGRVFKRALRKPLTWVLIFMVAVLVAMLLS
jgi:carbon monoxide dehydrogenase subunit G